MLRIENIAALHNEIMSSNGKPDLRKHIQHLVSSAVNCLESDKNVVTDIFFDNVNISEKNYMPLSLVINEWITNSVKYAATKNSLLELNISVKNKGDKLFISYNDNGVVQCKQAAGLGTEIINMLCRQMSGDLKIVNNNPYHYELSIAYEQ